MSNFALLTPEIFLLSMTCVVLLVDLFIANQRRVVTYLLTQATLIGTATLLLYQYSMAPAILFNGGFVWDPVTALLQLAIVVISLLALIYARDYIQQRPILNGEYYILSLFSVLGMLVLVAAHNLLTLFLGLELLTLPLYALVALQRQSNLGAEAAMKFFVMGALATALLLYGISLLYGVTGNLEISQVASSVMSATAGQRLILVVALVFVAAGIAFKLGVVPFHPWIPDVYQGAPTSITLFIGSAPKIAVLGLAFRFLADALPAMTAQWEIILTVLAVLSITLGNVVAIVQTNLKRMLAYSAIAHMGYMLLGLIAATPAGFAAALFYAIAYALMTLGGFGILIILSKSAMEAEAVTDLRGLNARSPWLAFMMLLVMFSMAGIPPLVGFFAKLGVLEALIAVHKVWLATYALIFAIIGAYYYLNVIKVMYFEEPEATTSILASLDARLAMSVSGILVLLLGLFPSGLIHLCRSAFLLVN